MRKARNSRLIWRTTIASLALAALFGWVGRRAVAWRSADESSEGPLAPAVASAQPAPSRALVSRPIERPRVGEEDGAGSDDAEAERLTRCWEKVNGALNRDETYRSRLDLAMKDAVEPWYYDASAAVPDAPEERAPNLFLWGLARAGLLDGRKTAVDLSAAAEALERAKRLDPENSAPSLFLALIEKRRGNEDASRALLNEAFEGNRRFDSYVADLARRALRAAETSTGFLRSVGVRSTMPVPTYGVLKELRFSASESVALGERMMRPALDAGPRPRDGVDYLSVEYAVGRAMAASAGRERAYPTLKEIWSAQSPEDLGEDAQRALEAACDPSALDPFLPELLRSL